MDIFSHFFYARSFDQLKDFTQKTEDLNKEVSQKVLILSVMLQANDLFYKNPNTEEIIKFFSHHLKRILNTELSFCVLKDTASGQSKLAECLGVESIKFGELIEKLNKDLFSITKMVIYDERDKEFDCWRVLIEEIRVKSMVLSPIILKGKTMGIIGVGSQKTKDAFDKEYLDVITLFSQNIAFIYENEKLSSRVHELEPFDPLTGLYNEKVIVKRLEAEVKRATMCRRPCSFVMLNITNYSDYQKQFGVIEAEQSLKNIAKILKGTLRSIDIAGRIGLSTIGIILMETNKRQAQELVSDLKANLTQKCGDKTVLDFFIAESPVNGVTAEELLLYAQTHRDLSIANETP